MEEHAAGNRCADFIAGRSRAAAECVMQPLRLELGESWLYVAQDDGQVVYADIRTAAIERSKSLNLDLWKASPSQSKYAAADVLDLCVQLLATESIANDRSLMKFLMCMTSDTLQYVWIDAAAAGEKVQQRCCCECVDVILDVQHVLTCPAKEGQRNATWSSEVIECLKSHVPDSSVSCMLGATSWNELIRSLFRVEDDVSLLRVMFGAFSTYASYQMLCRLGVKNRVQVKALTLELRERMFVNCYRMWRSLC